MKVVLFDLDKTLGDQDVLLPGARELVDVIPLVQEFLGLRSNGESRTRG